MKKSILFLLLCAALFSCKDKSGAPDVSGIPVNIPVVRFDEDFFRIDTNDLAGGLRGVAQKHPEFYIDFMQNILGVNGSDTNQQTLQVTREFIRGYAPIQQFLAGKFRNTSQFQKELEQAFRYVKYYFPQYKTSSAIFSPARLMHRVWPIPMPDLLSDYSNMPGKTLPNTRPPYSRKCFLPIFPAVSPPNTWWPTV